MKTSIYFEILIVVDGPLSKDFEALGKVHYWNPTRKAHKNGLFSRVAFRINKWSTALHRKKVIESVSKSDLIFMNTITNGHIQRELLKFKGKHICYVHEMKVAMQYATTQKDLETVLKNTNLFLTCSKIVKQHLVAAHGISEHKVHALNTPLRETERKKSSFTDFQEKFRLEHRVGETSVVVGVVGPNEWRKGIDFFLPLVVLYFEMYPKSDVFFVWKGFESSSSSGYPRLFDYEIIDVSDRVILLPHGNDAISVMSCLDVHLLLSREDPYPLVLLESASFGIPTLSFEGAGGAIEFIEEDAGYVVPFGNLLHMATKLNKVISDPALRSSLGQKAKQKVNQRHSAEYAMAPFVEVITQSHNRFSNIHNAEGKQVRETGLLNNV